MAATPEFRRVTFDLHGRDLPDFMAVLGDFVADHNITIEFSEAPGATEPSLTLETSPPYNPDLVLWMTDEKSGQEVAVITQSHLRAFARDTQGTTLSGERLANGLFRKSSIKSRGLRPYLFMSPDGTTAVGLRADQARTVLELLRNEAICLPNVGKKSVDFLSDYCAQLQPDNQE